MKIFQLNASYKPAYVYGGPTMSVSKLSEELAKRDKDVEVVTTTANGAEELSVKPGEELRVDGVLVTYYPRITGDHTHFSPKLLSGLSQKIRKAKSKGQQPVVHVHAWWNLVSILACLVARMRKVPVIISPRGTLSGYSFVNKNSGIKDYIHKFLGKGLLEYSYFHVTSEKEKKDVERLVNPKAVFVIPNFVRIPEWRQELAIRSQVSGEQVLPSERNALPHTSSTLRLLFISRVEEKKGLELLFESLRGLTSEWTLDIAGSGEESYIDKLKALTAELGISSKITWLGHVNNEQKFDVMAGHDVMVLPSFDENFANVVIECLSVGTAVLLTRNVGLADYAEAKGLGWVCERTREDLLRKLIAVAGSTDMLEEIRSKAPVIIREDFNEEKLVKEYVEMYEEVLRLGN